MRLFVPALLVVFLMSPAMAHDERVEQEAYRDPRVAPLATGTATANFQLSQDDASVSLNVRDDSGLLVGATYMFWRHIPGSDSVERIRGGGFCGASGNLAIPDGASSLTVTVDTVLPYPSWNPLYQPPGALLHVVQDSLNAVLGGVARCGTQPHGYATSGIVIAQIL